MTLRLRSIRSSFVLGAAGSASIAFTLLIALVLFQVDHSLHRQNIELERISDSRLAREMDAQAHLAEVRLADLFSDVDRRLGAIAGRSDMASAIESRNVVAIAEALKPAARYADVDSIVAVDPDGDVLGASSGMTDLVAVGQSLKTAPFREDLLDVLHDNSRKHPVILSQTLDAEAFGSLLPETTAGAVSHVVLVPLFDDFGDVSGGLLAQRWMRSSEPTLDELSRIDAVAFAIFQGDRVISRAGIDAVTTVSESVAGQTARTTDNAHIARCRQTFAGLRLCALKPIEALTATQTELTKIGQQENESLIRSLIILGTLASIALLLLASVIAQRITRPLTQITGLICDVAAGRYEDAVEGTDRADEVGDIARAVVILQASARERDSLRENIEIKNNRLKRQETELREQNVLFDAALNNMSHGLCMFDSDQRLIVSNRRYLELFDITLNEARPGMAWVEMFTLQDAVAQDTGDGPAETLLDGENWSGSRRSSTIYALKSGRIVHMTLQPLADGGWVAIFDDVTEREQARSRLLHLANHDPLTNLPNRTQFLESLESAVRRRNIEGGTFGILCLDLDEFKTVNDSLGHPVGDELLCQVAKRLLGKTSDRELVARMGGDEFAILIDVPSGAHDLADLSETLIEALSRPFTLDEHEIGIGVSIGIATVQSDDLEAEDVLKRGDLALYQAKADGRNTYRFFESEMELNVHRRRNLTTDLRTAVREGQLEAYFQPQINLATGGVSGFEALMRWKHPTKGFISPADFIPIAEETGLIVPMGEWILQESCRIAATWPEDVRIAVNISVRQLQNKGFISTLVRALATSGLRSDRLELEVTESVLLSEDDETRETLLRLKDIGVKVSMDDFGTGYSSLSCLRSFPFDKIKIDQSFIRNMADSDDSASIVRAIMDIAGSLCIATTAEGVETEGLVDQLRGIGCTEAQGYFFGRPAPAAEAARFIRDMRPEQRAVSNG